MINVGENAPDFTLPGIQDGEKRDYTLSDYRGRKVVLAFYPGDFTPGCTRQMCSYRDNFEDFATTGAVLLGISPQDVDSHERWAKERGFHFPLLADTDKKIVEAYGTWKEKSMYGKKYLGIERTTFIIDEQGKISHIFPKVKVDQHYDQVLDALDE